MKSFDIILDMVDQEIDHAQTQVQNKIEGASKLLDDLQELRKKTLYARESKRKLSQNHIGTDTDNDRVSG